MPITYHTPGGTVHGVFAAAINAPHAFIAGCTGSGKSTYIHGLICAILAAHSPATARLALIDPKRVELRRYRGLPHCCGYADTAADALRLIESVTAEMMRRFARMESDGLTETTAPHIYLICDEVGYLLSQAGKTVAKPLEEITMLGRAAHIHLIYACQNPRRSGPGAIPAGLLLNTPCRVALRCVDRLESRLIVQAPGAENLPPVGRALVRNGASLERWRVPPPDPAEAARLLGWWTDQVRCIVHSTPEEEDRRPWYKRLFSR